MFLDIKSAKHEKINIKAKSMLTEKMGVLTLSNSLYLVNGLVVTVFPNYLILQFKNIF